MNKAEKKETAPAVQEGAIAMINVNAAVPAEMNLSADYDTQQSKEELGLKDFSMPYVKIAQPLSPAVDSGHDAYIPGLKIGDLYNSVTEEIWPTAPERPESERVNILVVPSFVRPTYVEWKPRGAGGGFVMDHGLGEGTRLMAEIVREKRFDQTTGHPLLANGNELMETTYWFATVVDQERSQQVIFAFSSTGLSKTSKPWAMLCNNLTGPNQEKVHRAYGVYTFTPRRTTNDKGWWIYLKPSPYCVEDKPINTFMLRNGVDTYNKAIEFADQVSHLLDEGAEIIPQAQDDYDTAPITNMEAPTEEAMNADQGNY